MTSFRLCFPRRLDGQNGYAFEYDVPGLGAFTETVVFPEEADFDRLDRSVLAGLVRMCAILIGTSYYKAAPANLIEPDFALTDAERHLFELAYGPGLGEFYVRNELPYPPEFTIKAEPRMDALQTPARKTEDVRAAVAFGGGKDSHVAASVIKAVGAEVEQVSLILSDSVGERLVAMSEAPVTLIRRRIDPHLIELSRSGRALNGHIPITGVNSCLMTLYAAAKGLDWVVFANERAASEPTMESNGYPVNHQFSKSLEFEDALRNAFAANAVPVTYFSILRPVSELWTAHYLATAGEDALEIFASCNRNFVFAGPNALPKDRRWCGKCAKCVYTAVLLAPFLPVERHARVFQSQPLHDPRNLDFLREIAGLTDAKPWECVGERREVAAAITHLLSDAEWAKAPLIQSIEGELFTQWDRADLELAWAQALDARSEHRMPGPVAELMAAS